VLLAQSAIDGTLAACVLMNPNILFFPCGERFLHRYLAVEHLVRHKVLLSAFNGKHVADHLPGNSQGGAIPISPFQFSSVCQGEFVRLAGRQLGSLDQHSLDMFVPLFGYRHTHHFVG
jgi:hypothetical protein